MIFAISCHGLGALVLALPNVNSAIAAYCGIALYSIGQLSFFSAGFAALYIMSPVEKISLINSINAGIYLFGGVLGTLFFGMLADLTHAWNASFVLIVLGSIIGCILSIAIYAKDVKKNGPLHK